MESFPRATHFPPVEWPLIVTSTLFVSAVHMAYDQHYPLVLSPDAIWMCIAQGFANHVNQNAEKLRHLFVEHEEKKEIEVRRDCFVKGSPTNPWPEVFEEFSQQIRKHVGDKTHDLITPEFTTTGAVERAATQVVLMNTFKAYFKYMVDLEGPTSQDG